MGPDASFFRSIVGRDSSPLWFIQEDKLRYTECRSRHQRGGPNCSGGIVFASRLVWRSNSARILRLSINQRQRTDIWNADCGADCSIRRVSVSGYEVWGIWPV